MKIIEPLPIIQYTNLKEYTDKKSILLFTSPSAYRVSQLYIKGLKKVYKIFTINSSDQKEVSKNVKNLMLIKKNIEVCYSIGGGMVCDISKHYAYKLKLPLIIIPTIISTDAFLVSSTGLRKNGCVNYVKSKLPEKILIDFCLLQESPMRYHRSGCGDVLSIYTGLYDWEFAKQKHKLEKNEKYSSFIVNQAKNIFEGLIREAEEIRKGTEKGIEIILQALIIEVCLCNIYGNSRPEEGGEHFFTYCIENKIPRFLHGEMVCFAILITSFIQNQDWRKMHNLMNKIGINFIPEGLNEQRVIDTLVELPSYIKTHNLRHNIYNNFSLKKNEEQIREFIRNII